VAIPKTFNQMVSEALAELPTITWWKLTQYAGH
jgi:hypothetical protein